MIKVDCAVCGMPLDPFDLKPHKCLSKENPMKPHIHAELIKAWADGAEIQMKVSEWHWVYIHNPNWDDDVEYRIKPEPKPDVVKYLSKTCGIRDCNWIETYFMPNDKIIIKLTFDGETGELKSAEVMK